MRIWLFKFSFSYFFGNKNVVGSSPVFCNCYNLKSINVLEEYIDDTFCGIEVNRINDLNSSKLPPTNDIIEKITPESTPTKEIIIINISDDADEKELNKTLSDILNTFDKNDEDDIIIGLNSNKIKFNSDLEENQFIKPVKEKTLIDFKGGNLNLILPDDGKVTVLLEQDDANLSLKGEGEIELEQTNQESTSITLNKNSKISGSVSIIVSENVKMISENIKSIKQASDNYFLVSFQNYNRFAVINKLISCTSNDSNSKTHEQ